MSLRESSEEVREEPGSTGAFATKTRWSEHQKILLITENQTSQVNEFSPIL